MMIAIQVVALRVQPIVLRTLEFSWFFMRLGKIFRSHIIGAGYACF